LAISLGGFESLIEHPAIMSHRNVPADHRAILGITDNFLRFSVGLEDANDLINDLNQALLKAVSFLFLCIMNLNFFLIFNLKKVP
jgi:cystathionine gamma-lyase